jgi:predicted regulator of Ras-like GTPase activity (Roadblock/LC7/MglB family)
VADSDTRYEVAHCGADAYFYKPVEIADFLEAVKNCIGLNRPASSGKKTEQAEEAAAEEADFTVSDHLSKLRQKSGVECAVLIDEHGQVMAQAGNLPEDSNNPDFIISLMSAFSATSKVSYMFGREVPEDFLHVTGQSHSLLLTHVGPSMGLLLVQEISGKEAERLGKMLPMVRAAVEKLLTTLSQLGVPLGAPEEPQTDIQASTEEVTATEEAAPNLEAIFNPSGKKKLKAVDVDSFWELANQESVDNVSRADVISYEQARQLGLAPDEE